MRVGREDGSTIHKMLNNAKHGSGFIRMRRNHIFTVKHVNYSTFALGDKAWPDEGYGLFHRCFNYFQG
jgi:hypothetical protein